MNRKGDKSLIVGLCQFLFKFKEDEKFNRRNIFDISRIKF